MSILVEEKVRLCKTCNNSKHLLNMLSNSDKSVALNEMINNNDGYQLDNGILKKKSGDEWLPIGEVEFTLGNRKYDIIDAYDSASILYKHSDGYVYGAGYNQQGQLGLGDNDDKSAYERLFTYGDKSDIINNTNGVYYIKNDVELYATGANFHGQLGLGDENNRSAFTKVDFDITSFAVALYAGSFVIDDEHKLYGAGQNISGELGLGTNDNVSLYTYTNMDDVLQVYPSWEKTFLIKTDGTLWGAGANEHGELGLGDENERNVFTEVPSVTDVKDISLNSDPFNSFLVKNDGTLWVCGYNASGALGLGNTDRVHEFTQVPDIAQVVKVKTETHATYALTATGDLYVCGGNSSGQLGLGHNDDVYTFTKIPNISPVKDFSLCINFGFFITEDNKVYVTGKITTSGVEYTPGLGGTDIVNVFTEVPLPSGEIESSFTNRYNCILFMRDGTSYGLTVYNYGQLGIAYANDEPVKGFAPTAITGATFTNVGNTANINLDL